MRILFLDDSHDRVSDFMPNCRNHQVDFAYNAKDALEYLQNNTYDIVYLDHDLSINQSDGYYDNEDTGYDVARKMRYMEHLHGCTVFVHTMNYEGSLNIKSVLKDCYKVYLPKDLQVRLLWTEEVETLLGVVNSL